MKFWSNLIGYQAVWFITVAAAGRGLAWPGVSAALAFVLAQLARSDRRRADARLALLALACGLLIDGSLASLGWIRCAAPTLTPPAWILALWAAFALTLNHSFACLRGRPRLACLLGAIGGPLAYWGAARGWQAVQFEAPAWRAVLALMLGWALALGVLAQGARRWEAL